MAPLFVSARQNQWQNCDNGEVQWPRQLWHTSQCQTHTHARHNCDRDAQLWKPTGLEFTIVQRPAGQRELWMKMTDSCYYWRTVIIMRRQLLLSMTGGCDTCVKLEQVLSLTCSPSHHPPIFSPTASHVITQKNDMIWYQTVQNKFSHYLQFWLHSSWMARRHFWTRRWISNFLAGFTLAVSRWLISRARRGGGAIKMGNKRRERDEEAARVERLQEISIIRGMQAGEHADLNSHKLMHEHTFNNKKQQNIWKQSRLGRWVVPFNMWNKFCLVK